jgi:hypothetical protein
VANRGWKGTGLSGGASKRPEKPPPIVENAAAHLYPQIPPPPSEKTLHPNPRYCVKNLLDTQFPFWYFLPAKKRVLINQFFTRQKASSYQFNFTRQKASSYQYNVVD